MLTPKESAARRRHIADLFEQLGAIDTAQEQRRIADELDPPTPTYKDGIYRLANGQLAERDSSRNGADFPWEFTGTPGWQSDDGMTGRYAPTPIRVLADDELAIKREAVDTQGTEAWRDDADEDFTTAWTPLFSAVADALAAEETPRDE